MSRPVSPDEIGPDALNVYQHSKRGTLMADPHNAVADGAQTGTPRRGRAQSFHDGTGAYQKFFDYTEELRRQ